MSKPSATIESLSSIVITRALCGPNFWRFFTKDEGNRNSYGDGGHCSLALQAAHYHMRNLNILIYVLISCLNSFLFLHECET